MSLKLHCLSSCVLGQKSYRQLKKNLVLLFQFLSIDYLQAVGGLVQLLHFFHKGFDRKKGSRFLTLTKSPLWLRLSADPNSTA